MARSGILTAAVCLTAAPALAAEVPPATSVAKAEAVKLYTDCLHRRAATMDDGVSDAETIGRAIAPGCRAELERSIDVFAQDASPRVRKRLLQRRIAQEGVAGSAAVLKVRQNAATAR